MTQPNPIAPPPQEQSAPTLDATRNVSVEIVSCAAVEGRDGDQWKLEMKIPSFRTKFTLFTWLDQSEYPQGIKLGTYQCILKRGVQKEGSDPKWESNFRWWIQSFDADPNQATGDRRQRIPATNVPSPSSSPPADPIQHSIRQSVVLQEAVKLFISKPEFDGLSIPLMQAKLVELTAGLWPLYQNIGQQPTGGGETNASGTQEEPPSTPADDATVIPWDVVL